MTEKPKIQHSSTPTAPRTHTGTSKTSPFPSSDTNSALQLLSPPNRQGPFGHHPIAFLGPNPISRHPDPKLHILSLPYYQFLTLHTPSPLDFTRPPSIQVPIPQPPPTTSPSPDHCVPSRIVPPSKSHRLSSPPPPTDPRTGPSSYKGEEETGSPKRIEGPTRGGGELRAMRMRSERRGGRSPLGPERAPAAAVVPHPSTTAHTRRPGLGLRARKDT